MAAYLLRRVLMMIPTLVGVSVLMFALTQVMPGGPIDRMIQQLTFGTGGSAAGSHQVSESLREELEKAYGYDRPVVERYFRWMGGLFRLDFGTSFEFEEPVWDVIRSKLPVSLTFGVFSFFLVYLLAVPLGIAKALTHGSSLDLMSSFLLFLGYSIPPFALAIGLILFFSGGSFLAWFPLGGLSSSDFHELSFVGKVLDYLHHICLPLIAYVVSQFAMSAVLMKNSFLEQQRKEYVTTARAKGVKEPGVVLRHIVRNSLTPMATQMSEFPMMFLTGSLLIEQIFSLDGIGLLNYESIMARDYPVVLAIIMMAAVAQILGVLLSDILYVILDPRVSYARSEAS